MTSFCLRSLYNQQIQQTFSTTSFVSNARYSKPNLGKTSLVNRLVHKTFGQEKKTEGIKITRWDVPLPGGDEAHLNVWDFGGQEIMHATHQFFLTRRSLYLLVLSGREGSADQDAEYWLKLIESFGGESPVLVVLNKQREHPCEVNQRQLQGKYPFIRGFIKTDCDDCLGLDALHRRIKDEIKSLPHLRDGFPTEWFAVKDHLPRVRKNFVSFDEYRKARRRLKVKSEAEQNLLGRYLHDLGVMLNFREDERLQDTHVLKPQWVTEGIYTILNAPSLAGKHGELRVRDLKTILPAGDYPANMHTFVLDLMKKFELCFTFPDEDTHYLIPELLDIQEPEAAAEFKIPVIIRDVNWSTAPFAKLQALPDRGKPVDKWKNKDSAWRSVADGIEKVAKELRKKKNISRPD
jgi:internalin A